MNIYITDRSTKLNKKMIEVIGRAPEREALL